MELNEEASEEEMQVFLSQRGQTYKRVMPLAMRNLAIAQQRQKERYSLVRSGEWARPKASFAPGDYVMVKRETKNTLEAPSYPHVLRIVELRKSGVVRTTSLESLVFFYRVCLTRTSVLLPSSSMCF